MDTSKAALAITTIAAELAKQPANTPMDHGTAGHFDSKTKREGAAYAMALYIGKVIRGRDWPEALYEDWSPVDQADAEIIKLWAASAVAQVGK